MVHLLEQENNIRKLLDKDQMFRNRLSFMFLEIDYRDKETERQFKNRINRERELSKQIMKELNFPNHFIEKI